MRRLIWLIGIVMTGAVFAQDEPPDAKPVSDGEAAAGGADGVKTLSGMSILGNEEAPKSLVIVPWKSSELGDGIGISDSLDASPSAVDKEVFLRELHFYRLRAEGAD